MTNNFATKEQDPRLKQAWDEMMENVRNNNKKLFDSMKNIFNAQKEQTKDYEAMAEEAKKTTQKTSEFRKQLFGLSDLDKYKKEVEYEKQKAAINGLDLPQENKNALSNMLDRDKKSTQAQETEGGMLGDALKRTGAETSDELQKVLLGYKSFSEGMKSVGADMSRYMLKQLTDTLMQMIFTQQNASAVGKGFSALLGWGGGTAGAVGGFLANILGSKHHSGGIVPIGANAELPGTEEQLALLKGGERILSPAENTSYNNDGGGGSSPVVFNNFNVKAWDSKDVQKYLLENKQLLNSITYEGIKNNNNHLRNMVQNA